MGTIKSPLSNISLAHSAFFASSNEYIDNPPIFAEKIKNEEIKINREYTANFLLNSEKPLTVKFPLYFTRRIGSTASEYGVHPQISTDMEDMIFSSTGDRVKKKYEVQVGKITARI